MLTLIRSVLIAAKPPDLMLSSMSPATMLEGKSATFPKIGFPSPGQDDKGPIRQHHTLECQKTMTAVYVVYKGYSRM